MKKIILTNNSKLLDLDDINYDAIYTDSPYLVEKYKNAIYLDTLLDKSTDEQIEKIRSLGNEINKQIINKFFPSYKERNIDILHINIQFTNIFLKILKLYNLIKIYPSDEIIISITEDELYNSDPEEINRFANYYYWISSIVKIKNVRLVCKKIEADNLVLGHTVVDSWFLRLCDLDKEILIYNIFKKFNLISLNKKKIYKYKKSNVIREIEPYLHKLGFSLIDMPEIKFNFQNIKNTNIDIELKDLLDKFFENNSINNSFRIVLFEVYKKRITYYSQRESYTKKYISSLDKSIKFIITNTINGFDSHIFAKQLQESEFKIINVMHGLTTSFKKQEYIDFYECDAPDMTLCFNNSERDMYKKLSPNALLYPISAVQEAKNKRLGYLKRFQVNKMLKINNETNIFYPSDLYPHNNFSNYGFQPPDKSKYEFEKNLLTLFSKLNKRIIYKHYPMRCYIDSNPLNEYAQSLKNIKVIKELFDFRYASSIGDIFILGNIGTSSTLTWMLGENKPIVFLYTNKSRFIHDEGKKIIDQSLIVVDIDQNNWAENLTNILNKPYEELLKIWQDKKIYRDQFDEKWLMGMNLHAGKLASKKIEEFIIENI